MPEIQSLFQDSDSEEANANTDESEAPEMVSYLTFIHSIIKKASKGR